MSEWEKFDFGNRLRKILLEIKHKADPESHLGRPFVSAYQLAIEYDRLYHNDVIAMELPLGGEGIGVKKSLAQYIANQLSRHIKDKSITGIEGGFFSEKDLNKMTFNYDDGQIVPLPIHDSCDFAIFRLKDN